MPPSRGHFEKNCRHYRKDKGGVDRVELKMIPNRKKTSTITASEVGLLLISGQNEVNLTGEKSIWVVDSGLSFHLTPTESASHRTRPGTMVL